MSRLILLHLPFQDGFMYLVLTSNTMTFPLWTDSYNSCGPFTFISVDSITGLAIPNFLTLNSGTRTFTIGTASLSDVGIYNISVIGSL